MSVLTITDRAAERVRAIIAERETPPLGMRIGTKTAGCSGLMYRLDYVEEANPADEVVEDKGIKLFIDSMSLMYLIGSVMDWKEDTFTEGFTFENPNAKGMCGCGESFHV
ncbi:MAG: iron-sulfur cluster assembly accessory protein [Pseudomonadota bacterium]